MFCRFPFGLDTKLVGFLWRALWRMRTPFDRIDRTVSGIPAARTAQLRGASVASILGREPEERGLPLLQEAKSLALGLQMAASSGSTSWAPIQSRSKLPRGTDLSRGCLD